MMPKEGVREEQVHPNLIECMITGFKTKGAVKISISICNGEKYSGVYERSSSMENVTCVHHFLSS